MAKSIKDFFCYKIVITMQEAKKDKKQNKKTKIVIKGLDIDKAEYQEIVLSHTNHPRVK